MVLGFAIRPIVLLIGGIATLSLIALQMLVGYRTIHFKGKLHPIVHRRLAWALVVIAVAHAMTGLVFVLGLQIG